MKKQLLRLTAYIFASTSLLAQTWTTVTPGSFGSANSLDIHNGSLVTASSIGGPYISSDGSTWTQNATGISGTGLQGRAINSAGSWLYYGGTGDGDIYRSDDDSANWADAATGITISIFSKPAWFYEFGSNYFCVMSAAIVQGGGVYRSTDGLNWELATTGMAGGGETVYQITEIGGKLYAGSNFNLYESVDNGLNWSSIATSGTKVYNGLFEHSGRMFVHTTFGMEYSDDGGTTWDTLTSSIKSSTYCGFVEGANDTLYAWSASSGVFYTTDNGATWIDITGDLSGDVMFMRGLEYFNGNLYTAVAVGVKTNGQGTTTAINESLSMPYLARLKQNYPNPFNPTTKISFEIPREGTVKLIVYDILGNKVKELINENLSPGSHSVDFNAGNLSSGIYYYTLFTKNSTQTKKLMLLK